jgi:hypothetical protein
MVNGKWQMVFLIAKLPRIGGSRFCPLSFIQNQGARTASKPEIITTPTAFLSSITMLKTIELDAQRCSLTLMAIRRSPVLLRTASTSVQDGVIHRGAEPFTTDRP